MEQYVHKLMLCKYNQSLKNALLIDFAKLNKVGYNSNLG